VGTCSLIGINSDVYVQCRRDFCGTRWSDKGEGTFKRGSSAVTSTDAPLTMVDKVADVRRPAAGLSNRVNTEQAAWSGSYRRGRDAVASVMRLLRGRLPVSLA
jgi:hypothetical protein